MSLSEKVALVALVREEYSLTVALSALEIPKATWYYHTQQKVPYEQKYAHLRPLLEQIAHDHPAYGIPRITRELRNSYGQQVNHNTKRRHSGLGYLSPLAYLKKVWSGQRDGKPSRVGSKS